jgi:16S rRNA (uracil1498-N3)-methyltransferase
MSLFTTHAWTHVTLGPRILRAETAAIAALSIAAAMQQISESASQREDS